jgi:hypothetical protein
MLQSFFDMTITSSASFSAISSICGRLEVSLSPPQPKTAISFPSFGTSTRAAFKMSHICHLLRAHY